jgi:membrane protease YdiL (CAAX protease family)
MTSISVNDLQPRERIAALVGVAIAFIAPAYISGGSLGPFLGQLSASAAILVNEFAIWLVVFVILGIVLVGERYSLKSIGLSPPTWDAILLGVLCVAPLLLLSLITGGVLRAFGASTQDSGQTVMVLTLPLWIQLFVAVTAGFTEEILFRGYAVERVTLLSGSRWFGAFVPCLLFGTMHAPFWGLAHAVIAGTTGFWLTLIYLWRRNLWMNITAHVLLDGFVFLAVDVNAVHGISG